MKTRLTLPVVVALHALAGSTAWAQSPPPPLPPPPLILLDPTAQARCGGSEVTPELGLPLPPTDQGRVSERPFSLAFSIAEDGRTYDIRSGEGSPAPSAVETLAQAALAGWRFAPDARTDCSLLVSHEPVAVTAADPGLLARYFGAARTRGPARDAVETRLRQGGDCREDRPMPRQVGRPDFRAGAPRAGVQDWTVVRWNMDASGRPVGQQVVASSGDAAFDAEVMRATAELRTDAGRPQRGCVYNWYRRGAVLPAPPMPSAPADPRADCPPAVLASYRGLPSPGVVTPFLDRGVEGWALVRFDIAPWGEVGNVEVIDAQPASAFGETARRIVGAGRAEPGPGAIRCVQPVLFRVPADD